MLTEEDRTHEELEQVTETNGVKGTPEIRESSVCGQR